MAIFDKYLVNSFLRSETTTDPIPTAFYSEDFSVSLGDFTSSGDVVWARVVDDGNGDLFSARSGAITNRQTSSLDVTKITTQESTLMQFDYKTSTEAEFDFLLVYVDDVIVFRASGTNAWATKQVWIHGIGSHDISFVYHRDSSAGGGTNQVWVDNVELYNYEESAISNTETLFKKDVIFNSPTTVVKGELSVGRDILANKEIRGFLPTNGQISYRITNTPTGTLFQQYQNGWKGVTLLTSDGDSYIRVQEQDTEVTKMQTGVSTTYPNGYFEFSDALSKIRFGEALGSDPTKILVVNGESIFRGKVDIDDGSGVGGATNYISFATDRGLIGYNAGNLKIQASSGKGIRWSTDTLTFATAGEDMHLYQGRLGVGDYATAQQAQLTVTDYTAGTNNVAFFKGQAITQGDATTISINNGYSLEYRKEVKIGAVAEAGSSNLTGMALYTSPNSAGSLERVRIDSAGNVGIGTALPESRLHIYELGVDSPTTLILENGDVGINDTEDVHKIEFQSNDASANGVGVAASIRVNAENAGNIYALAFNTQNVADRGERMRIDGAGNVGIGTTDPQAKLHVANGTLRTWSPTLGTSAIFESTNSNRNFVTLTATSQAELWFGDATTQAKGRVRYEMVSDEMEFWTAQAQKMVLASTGNLGIGTTGPNFPLDVVGEIHSSTYVSATDGFGVDSTSMGSGRGISLYGGPQLYPQYGLLFATTADLGTHGSVTSDYATFFTMNSIGTRGWVFKAGTVNSTAGNVASINATGAMTLNSTATATNFILSSDERLKENIQDFDYEQYIKMDVKTYELKSEKGVKRIGVIAQELEVNHPEFVRTDNKGMKSVAYIDLLMAKMAELEARLEKAGI